MVECAKLWTLSRTDSTRLLFATALLLVTLLRRGRSDSLLVMKNVGIQISLQRSWRFLTSSDRFVPVDRIMDMVIHEGFHGYGLVIFYLAILIRTTNENQDTEDTIAVVFPQILPRKAVLVPIWRQTRLLLFGKQPRYRKRTFGKKLESLAIPEETTFCQELD